MVQSKVATSGKKPSKPIIRTGLPFTATKCPQIHPKDQDVILDLLCNLLAPIGQHRATHSTPSKGRKRKRKSKLNSANPEPMDISPPPVPELSTHVLIGLNSVTRHLQALAARTAPSTLPASIGSTIDEVPGPKGAEDGERKEDIRPLSLLILTHPSPPASLPHAHLPTLLYLSSLPPSASPLSHERSSTLNVQAPNQQPRLICFPTSAESRLASTLHIPRVGAIGVLEGAPGADTLVQYCRENVDLVECGWIEEGLKAEWMGISVGAS